MLLEQAGSSVRARILKRPKKRQMFTLTTTRVAMLKTMRRYGRVRRCDLAAATGITEAGVAKALGPLKEHKLVDEQMAGGRIGYGTYPNLVAITEAGNRVLEQVVDLSGWSKYRPSRMFLWDEINSQHRFETIRTMIAAERDIEPVSGFEIDRVLVEFRADDLTDTYSTTVSIPGLGRFRPDAVLLLAHGDDTAAYMVEICRGRETIATSKVRNAHSTVTNKLLMRWRCLAEYDIRRRFDVSTDVFGVLWVTTSGARIDEIKSRVNWSLFRPIPMGPGEAPLTPDKIFRFTTLKEAQADFYGSHWRLPESEKIVPLITGARS